MIVTGAMATETDHEPTTMRTILRELPRWRVAFVLLVVFVNVGVVTYWRGCVVGRWRFEAADPICLTFLTPEDRAEVIAAREIEAARAPFVPPWDWSRSEWAETFAWQ